MSIIWCRFREYYDDHADAGFQGVRCKSEEAEYGHCYTARSLGKCPELHKSSG